MMHVWVQQRIQQNFYKNSTTHLASTLSKTRCSISEGVLNDTGSQDELTFWLTDGRKLVRGTAVVVFVAKALLPLSLQQ